MPKPFPSRLKGLNPFGDLIGLEFTAYADGHSSCRLQVRDELLNPHGVVHGGVIYSMADTGMGGALYSVLKKRELCTTAEIKIAYFAAVNSGALVCDTHIINRRSKIAVLESEIVNEGDLVAKASGTFYIYEEG